MKKVIFALKSSRESDLFENSIALLPVRICTNPLAQMSTLFLGTHHTLSGKEGARRKKVFSTLFIREGNLCVGEYDEKICGSSDREKTRFIRKHGWCKMQVTGAGHCEGQVLIGWTKDTVTCRGDLPKYDLHFTLAVETMLSLHLHNKAR